MSHRSPKISRAWLESPTQGVIELHRDWRAHQVPPLSPGSGGKFATLRRVADFVFGCGSGFFVNRNHEIFFFVRQGPEAGVDPSEAVYLAGDFNGWQHAIGHSEWEMRGGWLAGHYVLRWSGDARRFMAHPPMRFKFVTGSGRWLAVPPNAPNHARDAYGNVNRTIDPERTGQHLFAFTLAEAADLSVLQTIRWAEGGDGQEVPLIAGDYFFHLGTTLPLGAIAHDSGTVFRLFAPRARRVDLCTCASLETQATPLRYELKRRTDADGIAGVWETTVPQNLHGWFYWYHIAGPADGIDNFDPAQRVLDPWALATFNHQGPGIVVDRARIGPADRSFATPAWQDLVIVEAHVRDLTAHAPGPMTELERRGFAGLRQWVENPGFQLAHLGVNCVELQPIQEFDNRTPEEYGWGYMPVNWFAPASAYATVPAGASGIREFQELVAAFHRRGMAVILDVVYNHVGLPPHLVFIDKHYYFEHDGNGTLSNWSGCGNDLRASTAMAKRLIIESCSHLIETYGVDGFRFDLADLIGTATLREVEAGLKRIKPDVILIAEPWSFRGHIGGELRDTGWASWNDGYREFVRSFVRGGGSRENFAYFLKGSPWHYAKWPAQTVNYTESHDDRTWIDHITENHDHNGFRPTEDDRRRTHLMAATLFMSIGIPMLAAGQDFLRSKYGVNNTYQRGDLNALDYRRMLRYPGTHAYFADWIAFRRSETGLLLRHFARASDGFFEFHWGHSGNSAAVIYNADRSHGATRLLFAINPTTDDATIPIGAVATAPWRQLADHERFFGPRHTAQPVENDIFVPPLGCALWVCEG